MTDLTREQIEALLDGATQGPWQADGEPWNRIVWSSAENRVCFMAHSNGLDDARDIATSNLVAAAPDLARQLLATMTERDEAQAAQAGVVERAAEMAAEIHSSLATAIRSLADPTGVKLLDELRARAEKAEAGEEKWMGRCMDEVAEHLETKAQLAEAQKREARMREALTGIAAYSDMDHRELQRRWPDLHEKIIAERDHECPARDYILSQYAVAALSAAPTGEESNG